MIEAFIPKPTTALAVPMANAADNEGHGDQEQHADRFTQGNAEQSTPTEIIPSSPLKLRSRARRDWQSRWPKGDPDDAL